MIRSMTGFARAEASAEWGSLTWEIRAVNHRYLETWFRLPDDLRGQEPAFRQQVGEHMKRGKLECTLRLAWTPVAAGGLSLDLELAERLGEAAETIRQRIAGAGPLSAMDVLRWPGVVRERDHELEPAAALAAATLDRTLEQLDASRRSEGERIAAMLVERLDGIAALATEVRGHMPGIRTALRERLTERLAQLDLQADPARFEQELVLQLTRVDVDEELDRLESHVTEARRTIAAEGAHGRRLDFLVQEFNREANTLASKSLDSNTTRIAVELKVLIEQTREQVQNVE